VQWWLLGVSGAYIMRVVPRSAGMRSVFLRPKDSGLFGNDRSVVTMLRQGYWSNDEVHFLGSVLRL